MRYRLRVPDPTAAAAATGAGSHRSSAGNGCGRAERAGWAVSLGTLAGVHEQAEWDVAVIGGGPAGLSAAQTAAAAGARTVILERAEHPRYKTCGGGLIGASLNAVRDLPALPARDEIRSVTFTLRGGHEFTRSDAAPILTMVMREEFDAALLERALAAGA
jgi:NADPH-dependent 2,4-dienoyl-CoA reductase/sulfur reductase-like enzyme